MEQVIAFLSGSGGVGKTSVAFNLGGLLAAEGKKVLLIDLNMGLRSLDLMIDEELPTTTNILDVLSAKKTLSAAVMHHPAQESLAVLPGSWTKGGSAIEEEAFKRLIAEAREQYDQIFLDLPVGTGRLFEMSLDVADFSLIISTLSKISLRNSDKLYSCFRERKLRKVAIILNNVRSDLIKRGVYPDIETVKERFPIDILGILPAEDSFLESLETGTFIEAGRKKHARLALENIRKRLEGEEVSYINFTKNVFFRKW